MADFSTPWATNKELDLRLAQTTLSPEQDVGSDQDLPDTGQTRAHDFCLGIVSSARDQIITEK